MLFRRNNVIILRKIIRGADFSLKKSLNVRRLLSGNNIINALNIVSNVNCKFCGILFSGILSSISMLRDKIKIINLNLKEIYLRGVGVSKNRTFKKIKYASQGNIHVINKRLYDVSLVLMVGR